MTELIDLSFEELKIPILEGVNDTPSTGSNPSHPNGALLCAKFNELIFKVLQKNGVELSNTIYLNVNEVNPNSITSFNNDFLFFQFLKDATGGNALTELTIIMRSDFDFSNFKLNLSISTLSKITIIGETTVRNVSFNFLESNIPIYFEENINVTFGNFYNTQIYFKTNSSFEGVSKSTFNSCTINFEGLSCGEAYLYNSTWEQKINTSLKLIANNSRIYHNGENYQPVSPVDYLISPTVDIESVGGSLDLSLLKTNYLKLNCKGSKIYLKNLQTEILAGVNSTLSIDMDLVSSIIYIDSSNLEDNTLSNINIEMSTLYYYYSTFTTNNLTNLHLESNSSTIISQTDPLNTVDTSILRFGTLPSLVNAIIYEDGVLLGR